MSRVALTLNQKLAVIALVLGAFALFSQPHRGPVVRIDTQELALIVEQEVDHVTPAELAAWIIEGRADYQLIDLRKPAEFDAYHIPTAQNLPLAELPGLQAQANERIVLYSEGGIHAAQAWMLLRARGYRNVYTVLLGLDGWKDDVLFPTLPANASAQERAAFERAASMARFFGGQPRVASVDEGAQSVELPPSAAPAPPMPAAPALPAPGRASAAGAPRKKKKEGC